MPSTLPNPSLDGHLLNSELRRRMAKVHTPAHRKTEIDAYRAATGEAIERARCLSGLDLNQFADAIGRDASQVGKWIRNAEPPQLDPILMSPMRRFMLQALAERTPECGVQTIITVRIA